jgi:hypothetical protein
MQWNAGVCVKHGGVLDIAIFADNDPFVIAAENGIKPDACIGFESDSACDGCVVGNKMTIAFQHRNTILETVNQPAFA